MKYSKIIAIGILVVFAAAMVAPTAMAQQQSAKFTVKSVSSLRGPIIPDIQTQQTTVTWDYIIDGQAPFLGQAESKSVTLTWQRPDCSNDQILVTGPLTETIPIAEEGATVERTGQTSTFTIAATTEAPGEVTLTCEFSGKVSGLTNTVAETDTSSQSLTFSVAYYGLIQASSNGRLKEASPQKPISYDITVTNFGNARTQVSFRLGDEGVGSWKPVLPEPLILESKVSGLGGDVQNTVFQVNTPYKNGWNNDERTFKLILTPTSAKSGTEGGNPVEVNVLARVRGVYVPTLEPMLMLGAILGTGLLVRLRKDE